MRHQVTIASALFQDTVEDSETTPEELLGGVGASVAHVVEQVTNVKFSRRRYRSGGRIRDGSQRRIRVPRKYSPNLWELDSFIDAARYSEVARCADFFEDQVVQFDDRNKTEYAEKFGDLLQAAFLTAAVSAMEHHLKKICDVVAELRNWDIRPTDLKGAGGFESCIAFLGKVLKVPVPERDLRVARAIVEVRNAWVHLGGYMDKIPPNLGPLRKHLTLSADGIIQFVGPFVQDTCVACGSFVQRVEESAQAQWMKGKKGRKPEHPEAM